MYIYIGTGKGMGIHSRGTTGQSKGTKRTHDTASAGTTQKQDRKDPRQRLDNIFQSYVSYKVS